MTRAEHLRWAKERALAELEPGGGGVVDAMSSIHMDFRNHSDLKEHSGLELMAMLTFAGHLNTERDVREFIEGLS